MTFEVKEPVLVIGLGGAGIRLASEIRETLGADSLKISQDKKDISEH
ncbi:MAG: cell division protein FtsZ, partial [Candidatus Nitrosopelagicus sp.]|nr:cell division protein FtsZ [Candidatus Nitrosopelagicus sp.]